MIIRRILWSDQINQRTVVHAELILSSAAMRDSHARSAELILEDVCDAGTRAILINAMNADSKDREKNGRSSSQNKNNAFRHGY